MGNLKETASNIASSKNTFSKSGYEIRESILELARAAVETEYASKLRIWELTTYRDHDGRYEHDIDSVPKPPTIDDILTAAQQLYGFVNTHTRL